MDNLNDEKTQVSAEPAGAENRVNAAANTGKFGSVEALLNAYQNLEAEFTRRSQRLKELENESKAHSNPEGATSPESRNTAAKGTEIDEELKKAIVAEYLKGVAEGKSVPLVSGGVSAVAPRNAPKTVKDAGALAKNFLNKI